MAEESIPGCSMYNQNAFNKFDVGDCVIIKFSTNKRDMLIIAKIDADSELSGEKNAMAKEAFLAYLGHFGNFLR